MPVCAELRAGLSSRPRRNQIGGFLDGPDEPQSVCDRDRHGLCLAADVAFLRIATFLAKGDIRYADMPRKEPDNAHIAHLCITRNRLSMYSYAYIS